MSTIINTASYASLEIANLSISDDLAPNVRLGLQLLRDCVQVAEATGNAEASDAARHIFYACRKGATSAEGERATWPWALKGVDCVSSNGEIIESFASGMDAPWLRPSGFIALVKEHGDCFLRFHPAA